MNKNLRRIYLGFWIILRVKFGCLAFRLGWRTRFWLVVHHSLAFGNMTFRSRLIEFTSAMRTLDVIARVAWRRWWQIAQFSTCCQVSLDLLRWSYGIYEILVFTAPVWLHFRLVVWFTLLKIKQKIIRYELEWAKLLVQNFKQTSFPYC